MVFGRTLDDLTEDAAAGGNGERQLAERSSSGGNHEASVFMVFLSENRVVCCRWDLVKVSVFVGDEDERAGNYS